MELSTRSLRPDELAGTDLYGRNCLILGEPAVGKTHGCHRVASESSDVVRTERLSEAVTTPESVHPIVDALYTAYHTARSPEDVLETLLSRDGGVSLVARPRNIDWLTRNEQLDWLLDRLDRVLYLRYDPAADRSRVVDLCESIGGDDDQDGINRQAVNNAIDDGLFAYDGPELHHQRLAATLEPVERTTLLPSLILHVSMEASDGLFRPTGIRSMVDELVTNFTLAEAFDDLKNAGGTLYRSAMNGLSGESSGEDELLATLAETDLMDSGMVSAAGASLLGGPAFQVALPFVWLLLRDDDDSLSQREAFDVLLGGNLPPHAREQLEAELDLPPRTTENLRALTDEETLGTVRRLREAAAQPDQTAFDERLAAHESLVDALEARLAEINQYLVELESLEGLVSKRLARSTHDLETFGSWIAADEAALLEPAVDSIEASDIEYVHSDDSEGGSPDAVAEAIREASFVLLQGPHGTGKTIATYQAARQLRDSYEFRVPNIRDYSPSFVRTVLTEYVDAPAEEIVVYVSYRRRGRGETVDDEDDIETLFSWLGDVCGTVVLECRSEFYPELKDTATSVSLEQWNERRTVRFEPFESEALVRQIIRSVAEAAGKADSTDVDALYSEVTDITGGNPELAKVATALALSDIYDLESFSTVDGLILEKLRTTLSADEQSDQRPQWQLLRYLAVASTLTTRELADLLGWSRERLDRHARSLRGYLGGEVAAELDRTGRGPATIDWDTAWTISPELYHDVLFRYCLTDGDDGSGERDTFDTVTAALVDPGPNRSLSYGHRLRDVASNLVTAHEAASAGTGADQREDRATAKANGFLRQLCATPPEPGRLTPVAETLIRGDVPVDPGVFEGAAEVLWTDAANRFADEGLEENKQLAGIFLSTVTSATFHRPDPEARAAAIELVQEHAAYADQRDDSDGETLIKNVFANVLASVRYEYESPSDAEVDAMLSTFTRHLVNVGEEMGDLTGFAASVCSMSLRNLRFESDRPEPVEEWLSAFNRYFRSLGEEIFEDPESFLMSVYALVLLDIGMYRSRPGRVAWTESTIDLAEATASSTAVSRPPERFLLRTYGMALVRILDAGFLGTADEAALPDVVATDDGVSVSVDGESDDAWFGTIVAAAARPAAFESASAHVPQLLGNLVADITSRLIQAGISHDELPPWYGELWRLVHTASVEHPEVASEYGPRGVLPTIAQDVADARSPDDLDDWAPKLVSHAMGLTEVHGDLPPPEVAGVTCAYPWVVLRRSRDSYSAAAWRRMFVDAAVSSLTAAELEPFFRTCLRVATTGRQDEAVAVWPVEVVVSLLAEAPDDEHRQAAVAGVTADAVHAVTAQSSIDVDRLDQITAEFGSVASIDPDRFVDMFIETVSRFENGRTAAWIDGEAAGQAYIGLIEGAYATAFQQLSEDREFDTEDDALSLYESQLTACADEFGTTDPVVGAYHRAAVAIATDTTPDEVGEWFSYFFDRGLQEGREALPTILSAFIGKLEVESAQLSAWVPETVAVAVEITRNNGPANTDWNEDSAPDPADPAEPIAFAVAAGLDALTTPAGAVPSEPFDIVVDQIIDLRQDRPEVAAQVIERVPRVLETSYRNYAASAEWELRFD